VKFASTTSPLAGGFVNWRAITAWWCDQCGRIGRFWLYSKVRPPAPLDPPPARPRLRWNDALRSARVPPMHYLDKLDRPVLRQRGGVRIQSATLTKVGQNSTGVDIRRELAIVQ
jgi:hypothetical protein